MSEVEETNTPEEEASPTHVTMIRTIERQVGEHVLAALDDDDAVAAITTLVPGVRADRIVSMPLDREQVGAIQDILQQAHAEAETADDDEPGRREGFLGFHTVLQQNGDVDPPKGKPQA